MPEQHRQGVLVDPRHAPPGPLRGGVEERVRQLRQVLGPVPQRGELQRQHVQPVEQVLAELPRGDHRLQVAVRGGDHADVHGDRFVAADPLERPLLEDPQQLHLRLRGDVADLVQEQRPAVRLFEPAGPVPVGPGEGPFDVAEQLAFEQRRGERRAMHGHQRLRGPGAVGVDELGEQFLPRAALAPEQHARVAAGDLAGGLEDRGHRGAVAAEVTAVEAAGGGDRRGRPEGPGQFGLQRPHPPGEGLVVVVAGAELPPQPVQFLPGPALPQGRPGGPAEGLQEREVLGGEGRVVLLGAQQHPPGGRGVGGVVRARVALRQRAGGRRPGRGPQAGVADLGRAGVAAVASVVRGGVGGGQVGGGEAVGELPAGGGGAGQFAGRAVRQVDRRPVAADHFPAGRHEVLRRRPGRRLAPAEAAEHAVQAVLLAVEPAVQPAPDPVRQPDRRRRRQHRRQPRRQRRPGRGERHVQHAVQPGGGGDQHARRQHQPHPGQQVAGPPHAAPRPPAAAGTAPCRRCRRRRTAD